MRTTDTPTGALLGDRYLLTRPLGAGASATVYLAEDQSLRREVAVKVLRAGLASDDAFLRRFRAEAVAVAGLNHPHVLRVFDWGEVDGEAWLVTEYLSGGSLRDLLDDRHRLSPEQTVSIGTQAADGLAYAHARGFVHRDVKPANLLFDDAGRVRIADFGVARALAEAAWTEPSEGLIGTVKYISPEQAQGHPVDGKADVYSLALVLYECLTGEVPFAADSQVATLHARIGATLPFHPALGELQGVLRAATAPDPAARIDAAELLRQLNALSRELPEPPPPRNGRPSSSIGFLPPSPEELTHTQRASATRGAPGTVPGVRDPDVTEVGPMPDTTIVGAPVVAAPSLAAPVVAAPVVAAAPPPPRQAPVASSASPPPHRPQADAESNRRRRWPIVVLVMVVVIGGAIGGVLALNPFATPTYPVPLVVGKSFATAQEVLSAAGFGVVVKGEVLSRTAVHGTILNQAPLPNVKVAKGTVIQVIESAGPPPEQIPTVVGKTCAVAVAELTHRGFTASCSGVAPGYSTTVAAGLAMGVFAGNSASPSTAAYGSVLIVQLSKGRPPQPLPNVVGLAGLQARATLQQSGFVPVTVHEYSRTVHPGDVITTTPLPGTSLQPGKGVKVIVSAGAPTTVPSLGGADLATAEAILVSHGLTVLATHGAVTSHSWTTTPPAGTVVPKGTGVILYGH
jgi:eukaryotic-like serine/threonine-protein kinase